MKKNILRILFTFFVSVFLLVALATVSRAQSLANELINKKDMELYVFQIDKFIYAIADEVDSMDRTRAVVGVDTSFKGVAPMCINCKIITVTHKGETFLVVFTQGQDYEYYVSYITETPGYRW